MNTDNGIRTCACGCGVSLAGEHHSRIFARKDCPRDTPQAKAALKRGGYPRLPSQFYVDQFAGNEPVVTHRGPGLVPLVADEPYRSIKVGEGRLSSDGYVRMKTADGKHVAEHRAIMEQMIGRPMRKGETVHHKNGIRHDNRPENLELWVGGVRYGQRASELLCGGCGQSYAQTAVVTVSTVEKPRRRRSTRNGEGVRLYISTVDAEALLRGELPSAVKSKIQAKLKPPEPIAGQQSIYDVLTEEPHGDAA